MLKPITICFLTLALIPAAHAQARGGGSNTNATSADKNAESATTVGKYANWDQVAAHQHGSIGFTGKVTVAGGQLPWDPVPVVVTCEGKVRANTVTDPKGGFHIDAAPTQSEVVRTAADPAIPTPAQLIGCKVNAVLLGFQSSTLNIANLSIMDNPDLGTITLTRDEHTPGAAVSATTTTAPPDALKSFAKAQSEAANHHEDSAQHDLEKAVHSYPKFAEAWYQLGKLQETSKPDDARNSFQQAIAADPTFAPPYEHLAAIAALQKRWQDVVDATNQALKLDPTGTPQIWYYSAVGNFNAGNKSVAETAANTSLAMDPSHLAPNTEQLLAVMLAGRGDYSGALAHLRHCLTYSPPGPNADLMKQQVAQLEKLVPAGSR
jgi:cytochrome c-type biogenesis protein CcmH/NrfG